MSATAVCVPTTPLEVWIAQRLGLSAPALTRQAVVQYQLQGIQKTVAWARAHSSFYAQRLAALSTGAPHSLRELAELPFTSPADLAQHAPELLCVSQDEISRIVTFNSSGTTGAPKRIFFTAAEQELALDFFANGVAAMAAPGDRMLIALPGEREGSVGYQLAKGIARAGVIPIPHGLSVDPVRTLAHMEREKATSIIGLPVQMLALAMNNTALATSAMRRLRSIVLCSDHVPQSLVQTLQRRSAAEVFEHYGMTEMGLGGGVDCHAHMGYHLRETDLYVEIVDPATGMPAPDGDTGEIVFTTLNRTGMPLLRYRTGDLSRFLPGPCGCGSILRRLERVQSRIDGSIRLATSASFNIAMLDEALFTVAGLLDFSATYFHGAPSHLRLTVYAPGIGASQLVGAVTEATRALPAIRQSCERGELHVDVVATVEPFPVTGAKRKIEVHAV